MMHRVLTVTSGYLKFTFSCMLGGTLLFALTGLAVTAPIKFLIVAATGLLAFLVIRMEVMSHRRSREISRRTKASANNFQESLAQWLAFTQATDLLFSKVTRPGPIPASALWVCEWGHVYDPKTIPASIDKALREKAELSLAMKTLERYQEELLRCGLYPLFVSKTPADKIIGSIQRDRYTGAYTKITPRELLDVEFQHTISICFIQYKKDINIQAAAVQNILRDSFRMIEGGIIDISSGLPKILRS